jgi:hypothetical protein
LFIPMMRPRPSFAEVRSMLQWADRAITNKESRPQVFAAIPRPPAPAPSVPPPPPSSQPPPGWRPSPNYRGTRPIYCRHDHRLHPRLHHPQLHLLPRHKHLLHLRISALNMIHGLVWGRLGRCPGQPHL